MPCSPLWRDILPDGYSLQFSFPRIVACRGVTQQEDDACATARKTRQGVAGKGFHKFSIDKYIHPGFVEPNPNIHRSVRSEQVVHPGFPVRPGRRVALRREPENQMVHPLAHEKKFGRILIADGEDAGNQVAGFIAGAYRDFQLDGFPEIQRCPGYLDRLRAICDPVSAESQNLLIRYPSDVVLWEEIERPESGKEKHHEDRHAKEGKPQVISSVPRNGPHMVNCTPSGAMTMRMAPSRFRRPPAITTATTKSWRLPRVSPFRICSVA